MTPKELADHVLEGTNWESSTEIAYVKLKANKDRSSDNEVDP
jgi:hypothetical protein